MARHRPQPPQKPEARPLEYSTDDELLDELSHRYVACAFIGEKKQKIGDSLAIESYKSGSTAHCVGLAYDLLQTMHTRLGRVEDGKAG